MRNDRLAIRKRTLGDITMDDGSWQTLAVRLVAPNDRSWLRLLKKSFVRLGRS